MAHEKVYGICENKCKEEVMIASQTFGIKTTKKFAANITTYNAQIPSHGMRYIFTNVERCALTALSTWECGPAYYSEVVMRMKSRVKTPRSALSAPSFVKWLNGGIDASGYDVLHFKFFNDGLNVCCWCRGYAE